MRSMQDGTVAFLSLAAVKPMRAGGVGKVSVVLARLVGQVYVYKRGMEPAGSALQSICAAAS